MRRARLLLLVRLAVVGLVLCIRKLGWLEKSLIVALMRWWMRIDARLSDSDPSFWSRLHKMPSTFEWSVSVVGVTRM